MNYKKYFALLGVVAASGIAHGATYGSQQAMVDLRRKRLIEQGLAIDPAEAARQQAAADAAAEAARQAAQQAALNAERFRIMETYYRDVVLMVDDNQDYADALAAYDRLPMDTKRVRIGQAYQAAVARGEVPPLPGD